jgi:hypothetical protein
LAKLQLLEGWTRGQVSLGNPNRDLITDFLNWQKNSAKISSELAAYFPNDTVQKDWNNFDIAMFDFFVLYQYNSTERRVEIIKHIYGNLSVNLDNSTLDQLKSRKVTKEYRDSWNSLKDIISGESDSIINTVINTPIPVFRVLR